jgi:ribosomal protein L37AE/L43A
MSAEMQQTGVRPEQLTCPACGQQCGRSGKGRWRCTHCDASYALEVLCENAASR